MEENSFLYKAASHHIDSFDFHMNFSLKKAIEKMRPVNINPNNEISPFQTYKIWYSKIEIGKPTKNESSEIDTKLFPSECRQRRLTYSSPLYATINIQVDQKNVQTHTFKLAELPIIVGSNFCNIRGMNGEQLVAHQENEKEFGGYFIVNGLEKVMRMLIAPRRHYPTCYNMPGYVGKCDNFTSKAIQMRCVREDLHSQTIFLHYLSTGSVWLRVLLRKQELIFPISIILKSLIDTSDAQIYNKIALRDNRNSDIGEKTEIMLLEAKQLSLFTMDQCRKYIGERWKTISYIDESVNDEECGKRFLEDVILVHINSCREKFEVLCCMIKKLYFFSENNFPPESLDSNIFQEILLPGHVYTHLLIEKINDSLELLKLYFNKVLIRKNLNAIKKMLDINSITKTIAKNASISQKMEYFLSTGNLIAQSNLDLQQASGFSIIADRLNNIRFMSHFRSIHRGHFFTETKTTTVRKLLPSSWGFLCPVHTPDGAPCGLLNHITQSCMPVCTNYHEKKLIEIKRICIENGMTEYIDLIFNEAHTFVMLDGNIIGYINHDKCKNLISQLRKNKTNPNSQNFPTNIEIAYIPKSKYEKAAQFPGFYIFTMEGRFSRPVENKKERGLEWIGSMEQTFLGIESGECIGDGNFEHREIREDLILSIVASTIPYLEYNQSPRNMYQCQMAKQTMGTPFHNFKFRDDNKSYRLVYPQKPIVRSKTYLDYSFDDFASATNAVVAVISHTNYDMEDAMIVNKASYERGFAHGVIYKSYVRDLTEESKKSSDKLNAPEISEKSINKSSKYELIDRNNMNNYSNINKIPKNLDVDGLLKVGQNIQQKEPDLCVIDSLTKEPFTFLFKEGENPHVDQVKLFCNNSGSISVGYKLRYSRNPVIGDKFSSRHGQKGVLSFLWPQENMPFTEQGIVPDIIINPHAFPSRMTIGMLIESMSSKNGALRGEYQTIKAFDNSQEEGDVVKFIGKKLVENGYNYSGTEKMYSGIYGYPMKVDIFIGLVYYQRLRHMVSDKSQARATGPIDPLTHQPVKGRKKGGGIRIGEMERDTLISHGVAYCLNERLLISSDYSEGMICGNCGSMLGPINEASKAIKLIDEKKEGSSGIWICRECDSRDCKKTGFPYVLRYLVNELAAMNIKMKFSLK